MKMEAPGRFQGTPRRRVLCELGNDTEVLAGGGQARKARPLNPFCLLSMKPAAPGPAWVCNAMAGSAR